jgi:ribosomal protein S18 acetylase RimI-like enzyme
MTKLNNVYPRIRQLGIFPFAWLAFRYVLRHTIRVDWNKNLYFASSLDEPILEVVPKIKVQIKLATINDIDKFTSLFDENKCARLKQRFTHGRICFVALDGSKLVGQLWVSLDDEYETEGRIRVKVINNEGYLFDVYVIPEYRNNRLGKYLTFTALKYLRDQGYEKAAGLVTDNNIYSLRAFVSQGLVPKKTVFDFKLFGLQFHRWAKYTGKSDRR